MMLVSYGNMYCEWIYVVLVAKNREAKGCSCTYQYHHYCNLPVSLQSDVVIACWRVFNSQCIN